MKPVVPNLLVALHLAVLAGWAQPLAPAFEAASIKPSASTGQGASINRQPGMLSIKGATLQDCIREAYGVTDSQIVGGNWLKPDRYDIVARIPEGAPAENRQAMLQTLLAERFKLAVHRGNKEMPVYALVVAKGGPRIHPLEAPPGQTPQGGLTSHAGYLSAQAQNMARLATFLSGDRAQLGHTVLDRTGLEGLFTFTLEWVPDDKPEGPSIVTALQEQLGLKLEPTKAPLDVLIVDHAEKASEN